MIASLLAALVGAAVGYAGVRLAPRWTGKPVRRWEIITLLVVGALFGVLLAFSLGAVTLPLGALLADLRLWAAVLMAGTLMLASFVDLHERIIPNQLMTWTLIWVAALTIIEEIARRILQRSPTAAVAWLTQMTVAESLGQALLGLLAGGGILLLLALLFSGGMGLGDVKLAGVFGLYLGWQQTLLALFLGFWLGDLGVAALLLLGKVKLGRKDLVAFGPYLAGGALGALLFGPLILQWYWHAAGL